MKKDSPEKGIMNSVSEKKLPDPINLKRGDASNFSDT